MKRIDVLDGFRGIAAFWVLLGHTMYLTGYNIPILSSPGKGVDLFIMLSGFLMFHLYGFGKDADRVSNISYWKSFMIKRFFRLSPLYYTLLCVALLAGPAIYEYRLVIESVVDIPRQPAERYIDGSLQNIILHLTYLFGISTDYTSRTALPDWSIGLEAQFYFIFPALVMLGTRFRWQLIIPVIVALSFVAGFLIEGRFFPSISKIFILYRLNLFIVGAIMAISLRADGVQKWLCLAAALAVLMLHRIAVGDIRPPSLVVLFGLTSIFFAGINFPRAKLIKPLVYVAASRFGSWMGELSYSVYLIHLLVLHPVAAFVIINTGPEVSPALRLAMVFPPVLIITYGLSYVTYKFIEVPGQILGQRIVTRRLNAAV
jgi:peptidoglycan/LPS O-acetylase OafA/YrhL